MDSITLRYQILELMLRHLPDGADVPEIARTAVKVAAILEGTAAPADASVLPP